VVAGDCVSTAEEIASEPKEIRRETMSKRTKRSLWVLLLCSGVLALVMLACCPCTSTTPSGGVPATKEPGATAAPEPPPTAAATIGEVVVVGDVQWKVLEAKNLGSTLKSSNQFIKDLETSGKFIQVRVEMVNKGKEAKSLSYIDLHDSTGRKYKAASEARHWIPDEEEIFLVETINPGLSKTFTAIYEVPADAAGLYIMVNDLEMFGAKSVPIMLGDL